MLASIKPFFATVIKSAENTESWYEPVKLTVTDAYETNETYITKSPGALLSDPKKAMLALQPSPILQLQK